MLEIIKELFKFDNIPIMLIIGVVIGYTIKKIIHLDKQVTNHLPTQIKEVNQRLDKMNERLDKMNERFDKMNERFDKMNERFDKLYQILLDKK